MPALPYLIFFWVGMRIDINKWDEVEMRVTRPKPALLSSLLKTEQKALID